MIKVAGQLDAGKYTVLCLDGPLPASMCKRATVGKETYQTEIVYDMPNSIGILGKGDFIGKEIVFD